MSASVKRNGAESYSVGFGVGEDFHFIAELDSLAVALKFAHYLNGGESCPQVEALLAQMD